MTDCNALKRKIFVSEWRDSLSVADMQIDAEHRRLFFLVKELNLDNLDQSVHELKDYVLTHFMNEQDLMQSNNYPQLMAHIHLHDAFKKTVDRFLSGNAPWTEQRVIDLKRFLNEWLIGHISVHDQHFGDWRRSSQPQLEHFSSTDAKLERQPLKTHATLVTIKNTFRRWMGRPEHLD